jgi:hypothetical protein
MEKKLKHLEFIQNTIIRMNTNSFLIKGWTITLVTALFALAAKDSNMKFVMISYIVIPTFWFLDGFFIATEKQYRALYDEVTITPEANINFNMNASKFNTGYNTWLAGVFSKTLVPFYGISFVATLLVMSFLK